mgnify:CR=1 FL=1
MNYTIIIIFAIYMFLILFLRKRYKKAKWNPFEQAKMNSIIKRENDWVFERPFKRFEYVNKKVSDGTVIGIYLIPKPKTKKQIKYEKLCKKWR